MVYKPSFFDQYQEYFIYLFTIKNILHTSNFPHEKSIKFCYICLSLRNNNNNKINGSATDESSWAIAA